MTPAETRQKPARRVAQLPPELVNQIAAGEVVERPSSVVKELLENALDAGASRIDIVLEDGGKRLIEVSDDGIGMNPQDARLALERHATSKIEDFEDLVSVSTLGFRGEALPSIASVSRFRLTTADGSGPGGTEIIVDSPEEDPVVQPAARDRGTTVRVESLFVHVPARRKFLKTASAELRRINAIVSSYAIPASTVSFTVTHNDRLILDLPSARSVRDRVLQILGGRAEESLSPIENGSETCNVSGFVARGHGVGGRKHQFYFVNHRLVSDKVITQAVRRASEAFDDARQPAVILFLEVSPEMVDVNVHPAKSEVRFEDSGRVFVTVERGVREALGRPQSGKSLLQSRGEDVIRDQPLPLDSLLVNRPGGNEVHHEITPLFRKSPVVQPPIPQPSPSELPGLSSLGDLEGRVIGQYRMSYVLVDIPAGLRLVDQHVAHERVLYDEIDAVYGGAMETQSLLEPLIHDCGAAEATILESQTESLRGAGFEIERFSAGSFAISAIPVVLGPRKLERFLRDLVRDFDDDEGMVRARERIVASLACQAAIKVHRPLSGPEMADLVSRLLRSSNPYACPHGRPIIVDIAHADVERHFHRR